MIINDFFKQAVKYYQTGNLQQAESACKKILENESNNIEVINLLGLIYLNDGKYDLAIEKMMQLIQYDTRNPNAYLIMGLSLLKKKRFDEAIDNFKKTIQLNPMYPEAYSKLGNIYIAKGQPEKAIKYYKKVIQIDRTYPNIYLNTANAFMKQTKLVDAIENYRFALQINSRSVESLYNLGRALFLQGDIHQAEESYTQALQIEPDNLTIYQDSLMAMLYNPAYDAQTISSEHIRLGKMLAASFSSSSKFYPNDPSPSRRLRIGYVSPDFKTHSVAYFIEPVLAKHNQDFFELFCYSGVAKQDQVTRRIKGLVNHWRNIHNIDDNQVNKLIENDKIDILVDLAGYTANNRILVFARKPAPVQVNWIGYPATTGLPTIDYKIVDKYTDPVGLTERFYCEKLIRLPQSFLCYLPERESPDVGELPVSSSGNITFSSFNHLPKISSEMFSLWVQILRKFPYARLMMKSGSFIDDKTRQIIFDKFQREGIESTRIDILQWVDSKKEHLNLYNRIDIALDTFPYNGTTTICEALWMGVPVITLARNTHASRVGASLLTNIGLPELIAKTSAEYIEIAIRLTEDREKLKFLRKELRNMMANSPLTNANQFTINLEIAYQWMWKEWCKRT